MTGNSPAIPRFQACASFTGSRGHWSRHLISVRPLMLALGQWGQDELTWGGGAL